jgi:penicillin V acylase-like amidase (Ntn superfamily)
MDLHHKWILNIYKSLSKHIHIALLFMQLYDRNVDEIHYACEYAQGRKKCDDPHNGGVNVHKNQTRNF